jgi:hypothetical protein
MADENDNGCTSRRTDNVKGAQAWDVATYTIASDPPRRPRQSRPSAWSRRLDEARSDFGEWRRVAEPMTRATASQVASDLRNAHRRDRTKLRMGGVLPGERWDAAWGHASEDPNPAHFYVWLRWIGPGPEYAW